jgi:RND family efflux transporter MFP subunit
LSSDGGGVACRLEIARDLLLDGNSDRDLRRRRRGVTIVLATGRDGEKRNEKKRCAVQGFVQAISYADGDFVKKGTSLFTIEPEPYRLKVEAAKAAVTGAKATLKQNEAEFARQATLVTKQVSTQANYEKALALRDSSQADVQSAVANEQQAEINLGYTNVTAPFDGVVSARQVSIGQLVGANSATVLSTIVQIDPIYVNYNASERDVLEARARLAGTGRTTADLLGTPTEIELQTESGYPHKGKLDYVAPTVDPSTGTPAQFWKIPIGFCCPAISCACAYRSGRKLLCLCPMSRSAAIRADATC